MLVSDFKNRLSMVLYKVIYHQSNRNSIERWPHRHSIKDMAWVEYVYAASAQAWFSWWSRPLRPIHAYTPKFRAQTCAQKGPQLSYLKLGPRIPNLVWKSDLNSYRERFIRICLIMVRSGYCTIPHFIALHYTQAIHRALEFYVAKPLTRLFYSLSICYQTISYHCSRSCASW